MKKTVAMMAAAMMAMAMVVHAEEAAPAAAAPATPPAPVVKKALPPAQDLELVGKVIQQEKVRKNKDGTEVKQTVIALDIVADGIQVALPAARKGGVDPATFVGKDVKVFAKGVSEVNKKGKKSIRIMSVSKIEPATP